MAEDIWAAFRAAPAAGTPGQSAEDPWDRFRQPTPEPAPMTAGDVASGAARNLWPSTKQFVSDLVQPVIHPIDTHQAISKTIAGGIQKLTGVREGGEDYTKYVDAITAHFKERYGGVENAKRAFASDPVGVLADASILFTGGGAGAARLPGVAGKVGEIAGTVGRAVDPINVAANAVKGAGRVGAAALDMGTGTGLKTVQTAAKSGYEGGKAGEVFRDNMRGVTPIEDVVTEAKGAVGNMRKDRGQQYVADMAAVGGNPAILDFTEIQRGLNQANSIQHFKGQGLSTPGVQKVWTDINNVVNHWKTLPPKDFHTAIGFDALKQKIGNIMESLPYHSPERTAAEKAYNAIKQTIVKQEPGYAKIMKDYEKASNLISETERTLSLGKKASTDTAVRKLQSVMRNNVNTNFGNRTNLAQNLTRNGAPNLMEALAGQSMNSLTPRGIGRLGTHASVTGALAMMNPLALATLPMQSPRLVGETVHAGGRAAGGVARALAAIPGNKPGVRRAARNVALLEGRNERQ